MRTVNAVLVALLLAANVSTEQQRPQDVELQAAIRTATVDGDLEKAAKLFSAIADTYKADRATAATALLHLADVYQKRGDAQARAVYQRIISDYADQSEVAQRARAQLGFGRSASNGEMAYRRVWAGHASSDDNTSGTISPDGRYLSYIDWNGGDLMLRDLTANTSRRLTGDGKFPDSGEYAERSAISRDGALVAYSWFEGKDRYQLRVGDLRGASMQARTVLDRPDVRWLAPHDWSPDRQFVAVTLSLRDRRSEMAIVKVTDGSVRTIDFTDWVGPSHACFSPDGRFLAYDMAAGEVGVDERDVVVVSLADGTKRIVAAHDGLDRVAAWSPDGSLLMFTSERGGALSLWAQQMENGEARAGSAPQMLKSEIGAKSLGITSRGSLYTAQQVSGREIFVAEVDFKNARLLKPPVRAGGRYVGMNEWPDWSRDGKFLSHVYARNWSGRSPTIAITSLNDGGTREIPIAVSNGRVPLWAPDGQSLVTHGVNGDGRFGIYRLDARNGTASLLVEAPQNASYLQPEYSPDGRKVYFSRWAPGDRAIVEYDIESGHIRDVIQAPAVAIPSVSPDGRMVATMQRDDKASALLVASVDGGEPRAVIRASRPQVLGFNVSWTPNSDALVLNSSWNNGERRETWIIPLAGGPHKVLDLPGYSWGRIRVHPDGRRVAYQTGSLKYEVWVLENFLPAK